MPFDKDGYPTDETLDAITNWNFDDYDNLIKFVKEHWKYNDYTWEDDNFHYFVTGGWSGNESIINAMSKNYIVWNLYYYATIKFGKYIFIKPDSKGYLFDVQIVKREAVESIE